MSSANKFIDDVSRVFAGAVGVAQGAKDEAGNAMKSFVAKLVDDKNFVSREEFEATTAMAQKAREEVAELRKIIEGQQGAKPAPKKRATKPRTPKI